MKCIRCGYENNSDNNIRCEACGYTFNEDFDDMVREGKIITRKMEKKDYIIAVSIVAVPFLIMGIMMFSMFNMEKIMGLEEPRPANSKQTEGILTNYSECHYDDEHDEVCKAVYKYRVDGKEYTETTTFYSEKSMHDNKVKIHYNQQNPNDSSIEIIEDSIFATAEKVSIYVYLIMAIVIISTPIILFVKLSKQKDGTNNLN